jgi:hypothetical protein
MSKEEGTISADQLTEAYIKVRERREKLKQKYDTEDALLTEKLNALKGALLDICKDLGQEGFKTAHGTVTRGVSTRYWTEDWEAMHNFIKDNDALDLLERRISQKAMGLFLEQHPETSPVGLNVKREYTIVVRKAK